ncbi:MAG: MFS transporter [Actinomycetia bacterium]|nr:MFS transporter [Actinomycetes bacterium]MCP4224949.1 MFS transporter [Actinomycetes bacterium]MCP5031632.1 MFS transporter [Actinomycetes bacterium]
MDGSSSSGVDGRRAWLVASAGSAINTWTFGVFYSFGAAFEQMADEFDAGSGATAAIFAITTFLFFGGGAIAGPLGDRYGAKPLVAFGGIAMGAGLLLTAQVTSLELGYLTYGVGVGVGISAYLVPMTACVGGWFERHRSIALGLYTGGIGLGTLLLVPLSERLIRTEGWRFAFRVLGVGSVVVYGLAALVITRPPGKASLAPRKPVGEIIRFYGFWRMYLASFFMSTALFVPFVFIVKYSTDRGVSSPAAAALISVIGVGSVAGRFGLGAIGVRVNIFGLALLAYAVQPFGYIIWLLSDGSYVALVIFAAILGAAYGGYVALGPVLAAELYGIEGLGAILGVLFTSAGLGGLIGPIAAGFILDWTDSFTIVICLAIVLSLLATIAFWPLRHGVPVDESGLVTDGASHSETTHTSSPRSSPA